MSTAALDTPAGTLTTGGPAGVPSLRSMTLDELAAAFDAGTLDFAAMRAECARREAAEKRSATVRARQAEWADTAHAQYLAAEAATNGYMLSRAGLAAGIEPASLWRGSEDAAMRYASEELRAWWEVNGRVTPGDYVREFAASRREERETRTEGKRRQSPATAELAANLAARHASAAAAVVSPAIAPGAVARYTQALGNVAAMAEAMAARIAARHAQIVRQS